MSIQTLQASALPTIASGRTGAGPSVVSQIMSVPRRVWDGIVRYERNRRDMDALRRMDDRMLADIGLTRGDITNAVAKGR
ncbi:MAG: DUF1127 domain-containing protein [Pseudomonadota bacterium]